MLKLTADAQSKLVALKSMPGWAVFLREVLGGLCREANDQLLRIDQRDGWTNEQIAAEQGKVRAKYALTNDAEAEVDRQIEEFLNQQDGEKEPEPEVDEDEANALPPRGRLPMEMG
jgi:hypothetical protein